MRGFALFGILVLHMNDYFLVSGVIVPSQSDFPQLDSIVDRIVQLLVKSKSSTLFSLFLGYAFWMQFSSYQKKGYDFGPRYLWRLVILLGFGIIHALFYSGDILVLYALTGGIVVLTRHWRDEHIFALSLFLLVGPYELFQLVRVGFLGDSRYVFEGYRESVALGYPIKNYGTFWEVAEYNVRNNIINNLISNLENGRVFKFSSVFLLGVLACKRDVLKISEISFWFKALGISIVLYGIFYFLEKYLSGLMPDPEMVISLDVIISGIKSIFFTVVIMAVFAVAWIYFSESSWLNLFTLYGKMSLTNYVTQGVVGTFIFYGFGLNLSPALGATWWAFISIIIFILQVSFSSFYLKSHKSGPLETLWRKLTWIDKR